MKITLLVLSAVLSLSVSAKSLTCLATLNSKIEENKSLETALNWMEENKVTDFNLVPESFNTKPVKVDRRTVKLDAEGNGDLPGIIVESYEKHGISYNYAAWARNGYIDSVSAENEVVHNGSGVSKLKNQTEIEYSSSSLEDGSWLTLNCEIID